MDYGIGNTIIVDYTHCQYCILYKYTVYNIQYKEVLVLYTVFVVYLLLQFLILENDISKQIQVQRLQYQI